MNIWFFAFFAWQVYCVWVSLGKHGKSLVIDARYSMIGIGLNLFLLYMAGAFYALQ